MGGGGARESLCLCVGWRGSKRKWVGKKIRKAGRNGAKMFRVVEAMRVNGASLKGGWKTKMEGSFFLFIFQQHFSTTLKIILIRLQGEREDREIYPDTFFFFFYFGTSIYFYSFKGKINWLWW